MGVKGVKGQIQAPAASRFASTEQEKGWAPRMIWKPWKNVRPSWKSYRKNFDGEIWRKKTTWEN